MVDDDLHLSEGRHGPEPAIDLPNATPELEPAVARRPRPAGARCDACHQLQPQAQRTRDGLLTVCARCARGFEVSTSDANDAIAAVASSAPAAQRRSKHPWLLALQAMDEAPH